MSSYPITSHIFDGLPKIPYRHGIGKPEGIVFHSTETPKRPDSAQQEATYEGRTWSQAFVHYFVDEKTTLQVADANYLAWGCGPIGNPRFIQIELCMFDANHKQDFQAAYLRYVDLAANLLLLYHLPPTGGAPDGTLWSHRDVSHYLGGTTHTDPEEYLAAQGISWSEHLKNVREAYDKKSQLKNHHLVVTGWFPSQMAAEQAAARIRALTGWHSWAIEEQGFPH